MKDLYNKIDVEQSIAPVVGTNGGAPTAVEIDLKDANSTVFLLCIGVTGSTLSGSNYWTWTMQHADDTGAGVAGSYANVAAADVQGVTPSSGVVLTVDDDAEDNVVLKIGYVGGKRFVKFTPAETGTGPNLPQAIITIKGDLLDSPPL